MYKVVMVRRTDMGLWKCVDMPHDLHLGLLEACHRADLYQGRNKSVRFRVVNNETGDLEYETL